MISHRAPDHGIRAPIKMDRNMLQTTIPWVLPGHAQQPDINVLIHSVNILKHIENIELQEINGESCNLTTPIQIRNKAPIQFDKGSVIQ